jgi:hypothetical protein
MFSTFLNPQNYRQIQLGCQEAVTAFSGNRRDEDSLVLLGCEASLSGDIWVLTAGLERLIEEIAPQAAPVWNRPEAVGGSRFPESLQLMTDADGWLHAVWTQPEAGDNSVATVHYSRWDGTGWSQPRSLLTSPDGSAAVQPDATLSADGKIVTTWLDAVPGNIYFSQADLAAAGNAREWSRPVVLPMPTPAGSAPEIVVDEDGYIYVAYAVPLNEGRGVYLTQSGDGGVSWLGPVQVFDGTAAGWPKVDDPHLTVSGDGNLHLVWTRYSLPPDSAPDGLYYARSTDDGESWSEAQEVVLSPTVWSEILSTGDLALHRIWQGEAGDLWHQSSSDSGSSWEQPLRVSGPVSGMALSAGVLDGAGRPWLLQASDALAQNDGNWQPKELRNWVLSNQRWLAGENLRLVGDDIQEIAAAVSGGSQLNVIFSTLFAGGEASVERSAMYHSGRQLEVPSLAPTPLPTLTPTPLPQATETPTPVPMPTATTAFPTEADQGNGLSLPVDTSNPLTGPLLGIVPAAVVVLIAFFIAVRLLRRDRR